MNSFSNRLAESSDYISLLLYMYIIPPQLKRVFYNFMATLKTLVLNALLLKALLVLSLELGVDLGTSGGLIAVQLGLHRVRWNRERLVLSIMTYGFGGILFAKLSLRVEVVVVMVRRVRLPGLGIELVGNRTAIFGIEILVAVRLASGVRGLSLLDRALVTSWIEAAGCDVGSASRHCDIEM